MNEPSDHTRALLQMYRDIQLLARDYGDPQRDIIAAVPFLATLDQIMVEMHGINLDEAFHVVGRCPICGGDILDSGYDDDPEHWWHSRPSCQESR